MAEGIWDLLMSLQTNSQIYEQILNNQDLDKLLGLDASEATSSSKLYRVLYCLQIIQSLIFEYK